MRKSILGIIGALLFSGILISGGNWHYEEGQVNRSSSVDLVIWEEGPDPLIAPKVYAKWEEGPDPHIAPRVDLAWQEGSNPGWGLSRA